MDAEIGEEPKDYNEMTRSDDKDIDAEQKEFHGHDDYDDNEPSVCPLTLNFHPSLIRGHAITAAKTYFA